MDKSKEYILMCRTEEIQSRRAVVGNVNQAGTSDFWEDGDWYYIEKHDKAWVACPSIEDAPPAMLKPIFLPRQDQVQEWMMNAMAESGGDKEEMILKDLLEYFYEWYGRDKCSSSPRFNSMEQLWLGYYMGREYNKFWNGEKWIEDK